MFDVMELESLTTDERERQLISDERLIARLRARQLRNLAELDGAQVALPMEPGPFRNGPRQGCMSPSIRPALWSGPCVGFRIVPISRTIWLLVTPASTGSRRSPGSATTWG